MTRVESVFSQVLGLTPDERQELVGMMVQAFELPDEPEDAPADMFTPEQIAEFDRRIDAYDSGATKGSSVENVFRRLRAHLEARPTV